MQGGVSQLGAVGNCHGDAAFQEASDGRDVADGNLFEKVHVESGVFDGVVRQFVRNFPSEIARCGNDI